MATPEEYAKVFRAAAKGCLNPGERWTQSMSQMPPEQLNNMCSPVYDSGEAERTKVLKSILDSIATVFEKMVVAEKGE